MSQANACGFLFEYGIFQLESSRNPDIALTRRTLSKLRQIYWQGKRRKKEFILPCWCWFPISKPRSVFVTNKTRAHTWGSDAGWYLTLFDHRSESIQMTRRCMCQCYTLNISIAIVKSCMNTGALFEHKLQTPFQSTSLSGWVAQFVTIALSSFILSEWDSCYCTKDQVNRWYTSINCNMRPHKGSNEKNLFRCQCAAL